MDKDRCPSGNCPAPGSSVTRRQFLNRAWWVAGGLLVAEMAGGLVVSLWPKAKAGAFGIEISVMSLDEARAMPVGTVAYFPEQRLYISRVESGLLALYRRCPHLGCVVPWLPDDPTEDDLSQRGRFNCPCHGGIFDRYGLVHGGPSPRPMDIFPATIVDDEVVVDTGNPIQRSSFDESQVIRV